MGILKIGVVGCGRIGKLHINNLINSVPGVQVVAAADPMLDKSGAREWLAERKITNVSTDFMDVINNPEVDVVFVCSSTDTHCDVSMAAVQAGKHVFCEKPIDYDIDKIKKLLKQRDPVYEKFADIKVVTGVKPFDELIAEIEEKLKA